MVDLSPKYKTNMAVINSYGHGGFFINSNRVEGSIIIVNNKVINWEINDFNKIDYVKLLQILSLNSDILPEILLIGSGNNFGLISQKDRFFLRDNGIKTESMDTGAACRTYNILLGENRNIAVALVHS